MILSLITKLEYLPLLGSFAAKVVGAHRRRHHFTMTNSGRIGVILDFDGTITAKDTISTLTDFGLSVQKSKGKNFSGLLQDILTRYKEDYSRHIEIYKPAIEERRTLKEEVEYYRSLREIELKSFERVNNSGLFEEIEEREWRELGHEAVRDKKVIVRKGFQKLVACNRESRSFWGIVSVNFSSDFIKGVIESAVGVQNAKFAVLSNQINKEGTIVGPEVEEKTARHVLTTSDAKSSSMNELVHTWRKISDQDKEGISKLIYIGDSGTDIECLTAEEITGIIISEDGQSDFIKTMKRIGIDVTHIQLGNAMERNQKHVYWARNFDEIISSPFFTFIAHT